MNDESSPMRRSPRQARGRQRVNRLLDAAEDLFGELGFEAATTNEIAARAGVPIGSLYQFFPHKAAIVSAVAARYRDAAGAALDAALSPTAADLSSEELATRLLDAMVAFGTTRMGFTKLVLQVGASPQLAEVADALMELAAARLEAVLAARQPALAVAERPIAARIAMTAVMALLGLATAEKPRDAVHAEAIIAEARRLLAAYLASIDARAAARQGHLRG